MDINRLLSPKSIAVLGASGREDSPGRRIFQNLRESDYQGVVYPINPKEDVVSGVKSHPALSQIQDRVDLAVFAISYPLIPNSLKECAALQIPAVLVLSETEEPSLNGEIARIAFDSHLVLAGPQSWGVINTNDRVKMNASLHPALPLSGSIAFIGQNDDMCQSVLETAIRKGIGFSKFISLGQKIGLNEADVLRMLHDDPDTRVIVFCLDDIVNGEEFLRVARSVAGQATKPKPLLFYKTETEQNEMNAMLDSIYFQSGIFRIDSLEEMFDLAKVFTMQPFSSHDGVSTVSVAGLPDVLNRADKNSVLVRINRKDSIQPLLEAQDKMARSPWDAEPVAACLQTRYEAKEKREKLEAAGIPCFKFIKDGERALSAMARYKRGWIDRRRGEPLPFPSQKDAVRTIIEKARTERRLFLPQNETLDILKAYGFPLLKSIVVTSEESAILRAEEMGYPVALKILSPEIKDKVDAGGVKTDLRTKDEVSRAYRRIMNTAHALVGKEKIWGLVVQEMAETGIDVYLGAKQVSSYGPVLRFGLAGVCSELIQDVSYRLAPLHDDQALRMIKEIKASQVLHGYKGRSADIVKIEECVLRLSQLAVDFPELAEVSVNPLTVYGPGNSARVVDGWIELSR